MVADRGAFAWSIKHERAARLLADDALSDVEIAFRCAIGAQTLWRWKRRPAFAARVEQRRAELAAADLLEGIASREHRVRLLNARHRVLQEVIAERAADVTMRGVPGGTSGVVARQYKMIGLGKNARLVEEFTVDVATLRELREIEKQAAQDLGQWTEKRELSGQGGGPIMVIEVAAQRPTDPKAAEG